MKFGLTDETIEQINGVFSRHPQIEEAIIYGSRAKGNYRNGSDIDLTLSGIGLNLDVITQLSLELDDLLLPYSFDISIYQQISNPDLLKHIQRVGIVFYKKQLIQ
ncbi:MAG: nucleotidyltransferase domain-containing protein [Desulfobacteraceae bacterium]|nr:MAG: nucleotidyltransferase domain-containing protein [Desulfobacteraceae bacterium]